MLPFNIVGEVSRTIALAVRLYGNVMSGTVIVGILISVAPFFFPVIMQVLGLLTGLIQAYIFAHPRDGLHRIGQPPAVAALTIPPPMTQETEHGCSNPDRRGLDLYRRADHRHRFDRPGAGRGTRPPARRCRPSRSSPMPRTPSRARCSLSLAMIESTAIYCFVVAMILIFANPLRQSRRRSRRASRRGLTRCRSTG